MTWAEVTTAFDEAAKKRWLVSKGWQQLPDKTWGKWDDYGLFFGGLDAAISIQDRLENVQ